MRTITFSKLKILLFEEEKIFIFVFLDIADVNIPEEMDGKSFYNTLKENSRVSSGGMVGAFKESKRGHRGH